MRFPVGEVPAQSCQPALQILSRTFLEPSAQRAAHRVEQKAKAGRCAPGPVIAGWLLLPAASAQSSPGVSKGNPCQRCPRLRMKYTRSWPWSSVTSCQALDSALSLGSSC